MGLTAGQLVIPFIWLLIPRWYYRCFKAPLKRISLAARPSRREGTRVATWENHDNVLQAIFETPTRANIEWRHIELLLKHVGATITEGRGSRVRVMLNDVDAVFHRPHPRKEASKGCVESVREFLEAAGVEP